MTPDAEEYKKTKNIERLNRRAKVARTRGKDLIDPTNMPRTPKTRRTFVDLFGEFRLEMLAEAKELGRSGATHFEVAEHFNVSLRTVQLWIARDEAFATALQHSQMIADGLVEASLFDKARGYTYWGEEIKVVDKKVVRVPVKKHVPPSDTAIIFWLKNRRRDLWRDVHKHEHEGNIEAEITVDNPRKLAMAMLHIMQKAMQEGAEKVIEHEPAEEEDAA